MADVFYTILVVWVLWRVFGGSTKTQVTHKHYYQQPQSKEGDVKITSSPKSGKDKHKDDGEYVDYEEVK